MPGPEGRRRIHLDPQIPDRQRIDTRVHLSYAELAAAPMGTPPTSAKYQVQVKGTHAGTSAGVGRPRPHGGGASHWPCASSETGD